MPDTALPRADRSTRTPREAALPRTEPTTTTDSTRSWRRRRNRKLAALVFLPGFLLGGLSLTAAYATGLMSGPLDQLCVVSQPVPAAAGLAVRVFNGSGATGLGQRTADELAARGFRVIKVANAPAGWRLTGTVTVLHGASAAPGAQLLARQLVSPAVTADRRAGTTVDVVLGRAAHDLGDVVGTAGAGSCR